MQPTYLPWIGYFDLIDQADIFVFLDSVQFNRRSWQQRNRVKGHDQVLWLTVPVLSKGRRDQRILAVEIDQSAGFPEKHLRTISYLYEKAPFFDNHFGQLSAILRKAHHRLADLNIEVIRWLCSELGITTDLMTSSSLAVDGTKVDLLVSICQTLGAQRYISAEGSRGYIEENNLFEAKGIELVYHAYSHPEHTQLHGPFVPYMSVLDLLFNEGPRSLSIIRTGRCGAPVTHS